MKNTNKQNPEYFENHQTAAWVSIKHQKEDSKVPLPADFQVKNAKDYVDNNEK